MATVISTRGLTKVYGTTAAVSDLDLDIAAGEVFGLLGPNGAGKTTTILMLLGLSEPTSGSVEVLGLDPRHHALDVKSQVGYLPDTVGFYDDLTGRQNLAYTARLNRIGDADARARIDEVLDLVGLADDADRPVGGYSRGMQQRLGLADALIKRPAILILDEPTANIDPAGIEEILGLVRRLANEGVAILLSSHLLGQVQEVCDRIGIFVSGELVAVGTVDELAGEIDQRTVIEVQAHGGVGDLGALLATLDGVESVEAGPEYLMVVATHDVTAAVAEALAAGDWSITHLRRVGASLDDVYRRYFVESATEKSRPDSVEPELVGVRR